MTTSKKKLDIDPKFLDGMDPNQDPKSYTYFKPIDPAKAHVIAITLVTREEWGALPPRAPPQPIVYPRKVLLYYDIGVNPCHNAEECVQRVRDIQLQHLDMGLPDIAYNFLIGGDGRVYEGRGYKHNPSKIGDKYSDLEGKSFDIAHIGRFTTDKYPYPDMNQAALNLLQQATLNQHIDYFFRLVEDKLPSEICKSACPYPAPPPGPGDPIVDWDSIPF